MAGKAAAGYQVLVVDDDRAIREVLSDAIADAGLSVRAAENGEEALRELRASAQLPRVILLDLMMPVMTGWEFRMEQLADARLAAIPVVALSARSTMQHEAFTMTVDAFLQKPVDLTVLLETLSRYCA